MNCTYCGSWNSSTAHRCCRCGRLLFRPVVGVEGTLARELRPAQDSGSRNRPAAMARPRWPRQRHLFPELEPRVVRLTGEPEQVPSLRPALHRRRLRDRKLDTGQAAQQALNWELGGSSGTTEPARTDAPAVTAGEVQAVAENAAAAARSLPVALLVHRSLAFLLNLGFLACLTAGVFVFLAGTRGWQALLSMPAQQLGWLIGSVVVAYYGLCCLANRDTPGAMLAGLELVGWDGRSPQRWDRLVRAGAALFSLAAVGMGLFWALADERQLTWHDYLSETLYVARRRG